MAVRWWGRSGRTGKISLFIAGFRHLCSGVVAAALLITAAGAGVPTSSQLDNARAAILAGRLGEAQWLLGGIDPSAVDRNDYDFLRGSLAVAKGDYDTAIEAFHQILDRAPALSRVRLELARAFFLKGDDDAAEHHFLLAEADGLPPSVQENVEHFLGEIRKRRSFHVEVTTGIASDSNVNRATSASTVMLWGLPFALDAKAQRHSGVGVTIAAGGNWQADLRSDLRWLFAAEDAEVDFPDYHFDDRTVSVLSGPRFLIDDTTEISAAAIASRRWYGHQALDWGVGGRVGGQTAIDANLLVNAVAESQLVTYDDFPPMDGPRFSLGASVIYGVDSVSTIKTELSVLREQTKAAVFSDWQYGVGLTYFCDLPWGFFGDIGTKASMARYDSLMPGFGATVHYGNVASKVGLANRHVDFLGFSPKVSYVHTDQISRFALYDYSRDQVMIEFTRHY